MRILILILLACACMQANAMDKDGNYAVWGPGQKSCFNYSNARNSGHDDDYKYFVMGYLTAYNTLTVKTYRISGAETFADVLGWLDNYCEEKQMHGFEQAVSDYIIAHHETRLSQPPASFGR